MQLLDESVACRVGEGQSAVKALEEERSQVLWRAVERVIPDIRQRTEVQMVRDPVVQSCCKLYN